MNISQILALVPDYQQFFNTQEMQYRTNLLHTTYPATLRRLALGNSRLGEPIELLSIGTGSCSVMVVGAPHPHELVGTLMADHLLNLFCDRPDLLQSTGATWHFIKSIDPDGVNLNAGWLNQPGSLANYFSSFFRPPICRQAEFTFPFSIDDYAFSDCTPENQSWRKALEVAQPDLLYSTHNCDFGGVFYFTSDGLPELDRALGALSAKYQIEVDVSGEAGSIPKEGILGVFGFPDEIAASIHEITLQEPVGQLTTGDSSAGYAQKKFDTFSLIAEVPYWCLDPNRQETQCFNIGYIEQQAKMIEEQGEQLIQQILPTVRDSTAPAAILLIEALTLTNINKELAHHLPIAENPLSLQSAANRQLLALRRPAMLLKLLEIRCKTEFHAEDQAAYKLVRLKMDAWVTALEHSAMLKRVPLRKLVQLQTEAGLLALQFIKAGQRKSN